MQPLIVANEVRSSVADFLATAFPSTTPGFQAMRRERSNRSLSANISLVLKT